MGLQRGGVDLFLGNKKQNLVAAGVECLRNGESGEEVSAGSAASDDGFEWFHTRGSM